MKESDKYKKWPSCCIFVGGADEEDRLNAALNAAAGLIEEHGGDGNAVRRVEERIHPDVMILDSDGATIKIDSVRALKSDVYAMPREGGAKVYIISNAEKMTAQAQSSLLLVIEEPPPNVYFILTTENTQLILQTIMSRCTLFRLQGANKTQADAPDEASVELAALFAELMCKKSEYEIVRFIWKNQKLSKNEATSVLTVLLMMLRNAAMIKSGTKELITPELLTSELSKKREAVDKLASSLKLDEICTYMNILIDKLRLLERNVSPAHALSAIPAEFFNM